MTVLKSKTVRVANRFQSSLQLPLYHLQLPIIAYLNHTSALYALSIDCYPLPFRCLCAVYSLPIPCLFIAYFLPIHCLFTLAILFKLTRDCAEENACHWTSFVVRSHDIASNIPLSTVSTSHTAYSLPIGCLFTAYSLPIQL
jgi:hypothetical protein